jgi:hypothetical protein
MLGAALKNTPLADPKNPLSQILGTAPQQQTSSPPPQRSQTLRQTNQQPTQQQQTQQPTQQKPKTLQDLLFGR